MKNHLILIFLIAAFGLLSCHSQRAYPQYQDSGGRVSVPDDLKKNIEYLHSLMRVQYGKNASLTKAMELDRQSREAFRSRDFETANKLITEAIYLLLDDTQAGTRALSAGDKHKQVELKITGDSVILTKSVPDVTNGKNVDSFQSAFHPMVLNAHNGNVEFEISSIPVFIEENAGISGDNSAGCVRTSDLDSPFGGTPIPIKYFDKYYSELGVKWIRYSGMTMAWDVVERNPGVYDWSRSDALFSETTKNGIHSMVTVRSFNQWDQPTLQIVKGKLLKPKAPNDMSKFLKFLATAVERYKGDGNDAPVVKYWQIENEIDGNYWGDTPENYAKLLKASYLTVKKANPDAKVIMAGLSTVGGFNPYFVPVLKELSRIADQPGGKYFDIFDAHWYGYAGEYKEIHGHDFKEFLAMCQKTLSDFGYTGIPFWITETGTYGGIGVVGKRGEALPEQSEMVQASDLVKRYVYFIGCGIKKIFWTHMAEEHHENGIGRLNDYFENVGLVKNPKNLGESYKKLAYFSYMLLIQKLEGCCWEKTQRLNYGTGVHAYRFYKNSGRSILVMWYDN